MELLRFHHIQQTWLPVCKGIVHNVKNRTRKELEKQNRLPCDVTAGTNKLHLFPAKKVALELCLIDSQLLQKIRPEELKNGAWTKKATKETVSPNVLAMIKAFNQLALLVPTEILAENVPKARAKVIESFIKIALECRSVRNFNSLKAILGGLQCTPVYRLDDTWEAVSSRKKKQFDKLCELMSEEHNWQAYRAKIKKYWDKGVPFVPFFGMFLTQVLQTEAFQDMKKPTPRNGQNTVPKDTNLQKDTSDSAVPSTMCDKNNCSTSCKNGLKLMMALSDNTGEENKTSNIYDTISTDDITVEIICDHSTSNTECQAQNFITILKEVLRIEEHTEEECKEEKYREDQQSIKDCEQKGKKEKKHLHIVEEMFKNKYCEQDVQVDGHRLDVPVGNVTEEKGIKEEKREKSVVKTAENGDCEKQEIEDNKILVHEKTISTKTTDLLEQIKSASKECCNQIISIDNVKNVVQHS